MQYFPRRQPSLTLYLSVQCTPLPHHTPLNIKRLPYGEFWSTHACRTIHLYSRWATHHPHSPPMATNSARASDRSPSPTLLNYLCEHLYSLHDLFHYPLPILWYHPDLLPVTWFSQAPHLRQHLQPPDHIHNHTNHSRSSWTKPHTLQPRGRLHLLGQLQPTPCSLALWNDPTLEQTSHCEADDHSRSTTLVPTSNTHIPQQPGRIISNRPSLHINNGGQPLQEVHDITRPWLQPQIRPLQCITAVWQIWEKIHFDNVLSTFHSAKTCNM